MSYMIPKKANCTEKKTRCVGTQTVFVPSTGELREEEVIQNEDRDFNFTKVFMRNFLNDLDTLGNKKLKVAIYIIENTDSNAYFHGTIRKIANKLNFSNNTVEQTIKILLNADFMRRVSPGTYRINVNHMFKGSHTNRMRIAHEYYSEPIQELTKEEHIKNYENSIAKLTKDLQKLKNS